MSVSPTHSMAKANQAVVRLVAGHGVDGDAHAGATVKHRSRVRRDAEAPNLRQVHLIPSELHDGLRDSGMDVAAGAMGENVTTAGLDLRSLPVGTRLRLGGEAIVELTGLRNPCGQLNGVASGLMEACLLRDADGEITARLAGVMGIVVTGGDVRPGDGIVVDLPPEPHTPLAPV